MSTLFSFDARINNEITKANNHPRRTGGFSARNIDIFLATDVSRYARVCACASVGEGACIESGEHEHSKNGTGRILNAIRINFSSAA